MEMCHVISVKMVRDWEGKELSEDKQEFMYAQYDNGRMGSGYSWWFSFYGAKTFESVEQAQEWWNKEKSYLLGDYYKVNGQLRIDVSTLGIRKIMFKKVASLR